jgi:hypothetical protein
VVSPEQDEYCKERKCDDDTYDQIQDKRNDIVKGVKETGGVEKYP